jgi:hypothetical protein
MIPNGSGLHPPARDATEPAAAGRDDADRATGPGSTGPADTGSDAADLGPSSQVMADEVTVDWRPSRHARRLLTLAAAALLLAVLTRNPALAGVAAPPLLLLGMARLGGSRGLSARATRPDRVSVRVGLTSTRIYEGEPVAVDVAVQPVATGPDGGDPDGLASACLASAAADAPEAACDTRWVLHPGKGIEPGSATAVNGQAARFTFRAPRWGKREVGTVALSLHDRWRLTEGRVSLPLPSSAATRPRPCSGPRWCSPCCRTASASTAPGCLATAPSSPASGSSSLATGSARSTGPPPPGSAASR